MPDGSNRNEEYREDICKINVKTAMVQDAKCKNIYIIKTKMKQITICHLCRANVSLCVHNPKAAYISNIQN